jgi:hypothetical protein
VDAHNLDTRDTWKPVSQRHENPCFELRDCLRFESGDPQSESRLLPFLGKTNSPFTINTDLPSGIPLAEIIVIEAFIQII